jgi:hypothetical protein
MPTPVAAQVMHAMAFWGVIGEGGGHVGGLKWSSTQTSKEEAALQAPFLTGLGLCAQMHGKELKLVFKVLMMALKTSPPVLASAFTFAL